MCCMVHVIYKLLLLCQFLLQCLVVRGLQLTLTCCLLYEYVVWCGVIIISIIVGSSWTIVCYIFASQSDCLIIEPSYYQPWKSCWWFWKGTWILGIRSVRVLCIILWLFKPLPPLDVRVVYPSVHTRSLWTWRFVNRFGEFRQIDSFDAPVRKCERMRFWGQRSRSWAEQIWFKNWRPVHWQLPVKCCLVCMIYC